MWAICGAFSSLSIFEDEIKSNVCLIQSFAAGIYIPFMVTAKMWPHNKYHWAPAAEAKDSTFNTILSKWNRIWVFRTKSTQQTRRRSCISVITLSAYMWMCQMRSTRRRARQRELILRRQRNQNRDTQKKRQSVSQLQWVVKLYVVCIICYSRYRKPGLDTLRRRHIVIDYVKLRLILVVVLLISSGAITITRRLDTTDYNVIRACLSYTYYAYIRTMNIV